MFLLQNTLKDEEKQGSRCNRTQFPEEFSPHFLFLFFRHVLRVSSCGGKLEPTTPSLKRTLHFNQSLTPLSAVVKGCVLEIFGPNVEAAVWESLVQPGGRGGAGEMVPVAVESIGTRQGETNQTSTGCTL